MTKIVFKVLNIIINLFYPDYPNSLGIGSSNSQQHGNRLNMIANMYLFPLFKSRVFVKKKDWKTENNRYVCFLYDKLLFYNFKRFYIEHIQ